MKSKLKFKTVNTKLVLCMGRMYCCSNQEPYGLPALSPCPSPIKLVSSQGAPSCKMKSYKNAPMRGKWKGSISVLLVWFCKREEKKSVLRICDHRPDLSPSLVFEFPSLAESKSPKLEINIKFCPVADKFLRLLVELNAKVILKGYTPSPGNRWLPAKDEQSKIRKHTRKLSIEMQKSADTINSR